MHQNQFQQQHRRRPSGPLPPVQIVVVPEDQKAKREQLTTALWGGVKAKTDSGLRSTQVSKEQHAAQFLHFLHPDQFAERPHVPSVTPRFSDKKNAAKAEDNSMPSSSLKRHLEASLKRYPPRRPSSGTRRMVVDGPCNAGPTLHAEVGMMGDDALLQPPRKQQLPKPVNPFAEPLASIKE